jgi:hypothetical protein
VRGDWIACRRCRDQPRGRLWNKSTSPHSRSARQEPAPISRMHGPVCEARRTGPIFIPASKPLALPVHIHPASSRATKAVVASNPGLGLDHRPLRHEPLRHIPPQGDHQFARQSNDHRAADAPLAGTDAFVKPTGETALGLVPQPQPGKLDGRLAPTWVAGSLDALIAADRAAVPGTGC